MAAYLTKTLGTPTNNLKWTFSGWIIIGGMSGDRGIFALGDNLNVNPKLLNLGPPKSISKFGFRIAPVVLDSNP